MIQSQKLGYLPSGGFLAPFTPLLYPHLLYKYKYKYDKYIHPNAILPCYVTDHKPKKRDAALNRSVKVHLDH